MFKLYRQASTHVATKAHTTSHNTTSHHTIQTSQGNELDDNNRHPTEEVSAHDERKPLDQNAVLLLLGGPHGALGFPNGDDHSPVGVGDEHEGHQVEAYKYDG